MSTGIDLPAAPARAAAGDAAPRRRWKILAGLLLVLLAMALARMLVGSAGVGWPSGPGADQIADARALRLLAGACVGAALAVSGVALQALLRNPLAEPFILGLSTGAGVGVMVQTMLAYSLQRTLGANHIGALVGASLTMLIVFLASRRRGLIDPLGLLLVGVVLGTINGAIILALQYIDGRGSIRDSLARWMMGYISESAGRVTLTIAVAATLAGLAVTWSQARAMDAATFSDAEAQSVGVNLRRLRGVLFLVASGLTAVSVVLAGPIAFVGLICPHLARLLLGPGHRWLLPGAALLGAALVVLADVASSAIDLTTGLSRMPIGIFTAVLGGPAFLWMLRPQLGRGMGEG